MGTFSSGRRVFVGPNLFEARKRRRVMLRRVSIIAPPVAVSFRLSIDYNNDRTDAYRWSLEGFGNFENWCVKVRRLESRKGVGECSEGPGATVQGPGHLVGSTGTVSASLPAGSRSREWNRGTNLQERGTTLDVALPLLTCGCQSLTFLFRGVVIREWCTTWAVLLQAGAVRGIIVQTRQVQPASPPLLALAVWRREAGSGIPWVRAFWT